MISRTGSLVSTVSGAILLNAANASTSASVAASGGTRLHRTGSEVAESIRSLQYARTRGAGVGLAHGPAPIGSGDRNSLAASLIGGVDSLISEHGGTMTSASEKGSRRTSAAVMSGSAVVGQLHSSRHSAESSNNIAEALTMDAPVLLQGGGILRVSKGPEKAVQYWHKETGRYVESIAESLKDDQTDGAGSVPVTPAVTPAATTPVVAPVVSTAKPAAAVAASKLATSVAGTTPQSQAINTQSNQPTTQEPEQQDQQPMYQKQQQQQQQASSPVLQSQLMNESSVGEPSSPDSPTGSQESPTTAQVAASAGRMHEILGRMFSDRSVRLHSDHEQDSDSILSEDTTASTFSCQRSASQRSILQRQQQQQPQTQPTQQPGQVSRGGGEIEGPHRLDNDDSQSIERYDMLVPVPEDSDLETEQESDLTARPSDHSPRAAINGNISKVNGTGTNTGTNTATRTSTSKATGTGSNRASTLTIPESDPSLIKKSSFSGTEKPFYSNAPLMRTFSGGLPSNSSGGSSNNTANLRGLLKPRQNSSSSSHQRRPLAQTPLHSPSVQLGSSSSSASVAIGDLSRQSSSHSIGGGGSGSKPIVLEYIESPTSLSPAVSPWNDLNTVEGQNGLNRHGSIGTICTESSYRTARSDSHSDNDDNDDDEEPPRVVDLYRSTLT
ncbi:hypothetical protein BGZ65_007791 [Modicella reniformis]|uniref:Uncharacterized protein n=1 Tax=Modicella reniformis TaxID=1440133 RepID=A0A9P6IUU1_9FUNG|nr:hypothetical protein BGZ65_007791 [Modicella reniformis]